MAEAAGKRRRRPTERASGDSGWYAGGVPHAARKRAKRQLNDGTKLKSDSVGESDMITAAVEPITRGLSPRTDDFYSPSTSLPFAIHSSPQTSESKRKRARASKTGPQTVPLSSKSDITAPSKAPLHSSSPIVALQDSPLQAKSRKRQPDTKTVVLRNSQVQGTMIFSSGMGNLHSSGSRQSTSPGNVLEMDQCESERLRSQWRGQRALRSANYADHIDNDEVGNSIPPDWNTKTTCTRQILSGQDDSPIRINQQTTAKNDTKHVPIIHDLRNSPRSLPTDSPPVSKRTGRAIIRGVRAILKMRHSIGRNINLVDIVSEYSEIHQLLEETVVAAESNSMLLMGPRGSGKSAAINKAIGKLQLDHGDNFYTVRLNGFFLTDDKLAIREIWRQLITQMGIEDDESDRSYSDHMAKLLALLSTTPDTDEFGFKTTVPKSVIIVMDEIDRFASHPRQTLLYNLFDIAQSKKAPVAIIGMTTHIDIADSFEKRVNSRFSQRYIYMPPANSLPLFTDMCRQNLNLVSEDFDMLQPRMDVDVDILKTFATAWNNIVKDTISQPRIVELLELEFSMSKLVPNALFDIKEHVIYQFQRQILNDKYLPFQTLAPPDSKLFFLQYLPTLALSLLIAGARLSIKYDGAPIAFCKVYDEYSTLAAMARAAAINGGAIATGASTRVWSSEVAMGEWERLVAYGHFLPVPGYNTAQLYYCDVALEDVLPSIPGLDRVQEKWCRQL